jgi:hypothetical protein
LRRIHSLGVERIRVLLDASSSIIPRRGTPASLDAFETTLAMPFEPTTAEVSLRLPLSFTEEDGWSGEWEWLRGIGPDGDDGNSSDERTEPLGELSAR